MQGVSVNIFCHLSPPTETEAAMAVVQDVVRTIRTLRAELGLPRSQRVACEIRGGVRVVPWSVTDVRRYIEQLGNVRIIRDDF